MFLLFLQTYVYQLVLSWKGGVYLKQCMERGVCLIFRAAAYHKLLLQEHVVMAEISRLAGRLFMNAFSRLNQFFYFDFHIYINLDFKIWLTGPIVCFAHWVGHCWIKVCHHVSICRWFMFFELSCLNLLHLCCSQHPCHVISIMLTLM